MVAYQTEYFRPRQTSVIKLLMAEKCKQYEIYRTMCNVKEEYFCPNFFLQMGKKWLCHYESKLNSR